MARVKVTGYMYSDDMGPFYDSTHEMGITEAGHLNAQVVAQFQDGEVLNVHLDGIEFEAVND